MPSAPTSSGTSGDVRSAACASARTQLPDADADGDRRPGRGSSLRMNSEPTISAPSPTPTPMAAGRLRPARRVGGVGGGRQPAPAAACHRASPAPARALGRGSDMVLMCGVTGGTSDLEQLGFLVLEQLVDGVDVLLASGRRAPSRRGGLVLAGLAVLDQLVELVLGLAADVADRDLGVLGLVRASLMYSWRRSSVSSGRTTRMTLPSLLGLTPRSESRSVFSISPIADLSNGVMRIVRGLGRLERRELLQRRRRAVVVDRELVEHAPGWRGRCGCAAKSSLATSTAFSIFSSASRRVSSITGSSGVLASAGRRWSAWACSARQAVTSVPIFSPAAPGRCCPRPPCRRRPSAACCPCRG